MKASLTLGLLLICAASHAADLTLTDGRTFHDAIIVSQTPRKVVIKHTDGLSGIEKSLLPAALSARYPIDEAAAREADLQTAEARARAGQFHKAEAERAALIRLEREQTALHNAQIAALEASQRLAEAETARIARQRTEVVYEYIPLHRSTRYVYTPSSPRENRWDANDPRRPFIRHDHATRDDRGPANDRPNPRSRANFTNTVHCDDQQPATPTPPTCLPEDKQPVKTNAGFAITRR